VEAITVPAPVSFAQEKPQMLGFAAFQPDKKNMALLDGGRNLKDEIWWDTVILDDDRFRLAAMVGLYGLALS